MDESVWRGFYEGISKSLPVDAFSLSVQRGVLVAGLMLMAILMYHLIWRPSGSFIDSKVRFNSIMTAYWSLSEQVAIAEAKAEALSDELDLLIKEKAASPKAAPPSSIPFFQPTGIDTSGRPPVPAPS